MIDIKNLKVFLKINDFSFKTTGYLEQNILKFSFNDTKYLFDKENIIFEKEDKEKKLVFKFNENILILHDKLLNRNFNINLLIKNLQNKINEVIINYQIEKENFEFLISFMEE